MLTLWFATGVLCRQVGTEPEPELVSVGGWLPTIYVRDKKQRREIEEAVEDAVIEAVEARPDLTAIMRSEIARTIARQYEDAGLRLKELEAFAEAVENRLIAERTKRNNDAIAILLMAT
jgi:hypothetical protein